MSVQALPTLLSRIGALLPATLPKSAAYILPASTLTALGHPTLLGPLFTHVAGANPRIVSLHLRDMLLKEWTLIGIPLVISAVASLGAAEKQMNLFPNGASTFANPSWNVGTHSPSGQLPGDSLGVESILSARYRTNNLDASPHSVVSERGATHLRRLYREHLPEIMATWGSHEADFRWLEENKSGDDKCDYGAGPEGSVSLASAWIAQIRREEERR
ncbi:hypothetical protein C8F01DRAFT_1257064 [Mycena amicta]|nr:hypothetical protein C8F01DRAFT_1257064 [Mycena amicta]